MKTTHYLTNVVDGTRHVVKFVAFGKTCTISSETRGTERDGVGKSVRGLISQTPKTNWSLVAGRRFYKKYLRHGYVA